MFHLLKARLLAGFLLSVNPYASGMPSSVSFCRA